MKEIELLTSKHGNDDYVQWFESLRGDYKLLQPILKPFVRVQHQHNDVFDFFYLFATIKF